MLRRTLLARPLLALLGGSPLLQPAFGRPAFGQPAFGQSTNKPPAAAPVVTVATVADLKALATRPPVVLLQGYWAAGDGGGGWVTWFDGDSTAANDGTVFQCTSGPPGRYKRAVVKADGVPSDWFGVIGDKATRDITERLQAACDSCFGNNPGDSIKLRLTQGAVRTTRPVTIAARYPVIDGNSRDGTVIHFDDSAGNCLDFGGADTNHCVPQLTNFAIVGSNAGNGGCLNFEGVRGYVLDFTMRNLNLSSGGDCAVCVTHGMFSGVWQECSFSSKRGHGVRVCCNNSVAWIGCYARETGPFKAGYRLAGVVNMFACNGINEGDFWGVFGGRPSATDGFQDDFPYNNYPSVTMIGCNVEDWAQGARHGDVSALYFAAAVGRCNIQATFLRGAWGNAMPYHSVIRFVRQALSRDRAAVISPIGWHRGAGALTSGYALYADQEMAILDDGGIMARAGDTMVGTQSLSRSYPTIVR